MRKILLTLTACMVMLGAETADAQRTPVRKHKKYRKHNSKPTYYYNNGDHSISEKPPGSGSDVKRPSSYKGDNVPENDGHKKNEQRNINYNSGQPLPSNSGR